MRQASLTSTIALIGWRNWLWYALRIEGVREWALRIRHCHSNARKLAVLERKIVEVQYECTDGTLRNPHCSAEEMVHAIAVRCGAVVNRQISRATCPRCGKKGLSP